MKPRIAAVNDEKGYTVTIQSIKNKITITVLSLFLIMWSGMGVFLFVQIFINKADIPIPLLVFLSMMWLIGEIASFQTIMWNAFGRK